ncbi:COCA1-like protein, partial [Mya arenaria]
MYIRNYYTTCGFSKTDIVFVTDSSESIAEADWKKMQGFMKKLAGQTDTRGTTRMGSVSYNHFTYINFHLNEYKKPVDLVTAIENIPYRRGSTDTAAGIKTAVDEMFVPDKGDRPGVPNIMIIITDGASDDPANTIAQSMRAHEAGIRCIAIGIGSGVNQTELRLMSSSPEDMFVAKNFDIALDAITSQIFVTTCTDRPFPPMEEDLCGLNPYNPKKEICCGGTVYPLVGGGKTECCGNDVIDGDAFMCCSGQRQPRFAGKFTECCCEESYDTRDTICCDATIAPLVAGENTACCGNVSYDSKDRFCCD